MKTCCACNGRLMHVSKKPLQCCGTTASASSHIRVSGISISVSHGTLNLSGPSTCNLLTGISHGDTTSIRATGVAGLGGGTTTNGDCVQAAPFCEELATTAQKFQSDAIGHLPVEVPTRRKERPPQVAPHHRRRLGRDIGNTCWKTFLQSDMAASPGTVESTLNRVLKIC